MGRRKIEIKAIKDDRNRSVTFLKRKGGLFKKAHELSVLCSVDVAVIIFGNNKKLYEYSSSDISEILTRYQYYGGANEHKGPADFNGKGGKDTDDDDGDDGSGISANGGSVEPQMMPPQFQNRAAFQHIRHQSPMNSPPMPSGAFHPHQRQHTPQPGPRPSSRNDNVHMGVNGPRRQSSNLVPQQHPHPQPASNYAYMPNPPMYNPNQPGMSQQNHGLPSQMQVQPMQAPMQAPMHASQGMARQGPQYSNYGPPQQQQQQIQQMYAEEQRRASMPPAFPQQEPPASRLEPSPPQSHTAQLKQESEPPQQERLLEPVKRMSVKSRSIFTPIDEGRSILSQHWAMNSSSSAEAARAETITTNNRSQSVDVGAVSRPMTQNDSPPSRTQMNPKDRLQSMPGAPEGFHPPSRTNSASIGGKRPVLKVQIPDEGSEDGGSATVESSSPNTSNQRRSGNNDHAGTGVVLPPPSPSATALLSAGASGPPNPFARPHQPVSQSSQNSNPNLIDTPVSALPSRFMNNDFLPSPSSFYPDWNFGGRESNTLPSPLNFATPVVTTGPSFPREGSGDRVNGKRKSPDQEGGSGEENGGGKRMKQSSP
ncbi:MADS-box MEF2 type transcription factor [Calycina marina]|uniref:MADS-box MEF2 type transcription factor n=1 Tax=Calycina marina TaxID=1763456 RepID=A0A9P7YYW4_9HELO|nr:MADS-box MEF2 type transcription factor [Calycina marina]